MSTYDSNVILAPKHLILPYKATAPPSTANSFFISGGQLCYVSGAALVTLKISSANLLIQ